MKHLGHIVAGDKMEGEIEQFIAITGADRQDAERILEACNGNIELAIEMHLDSGIATTAVPSSLVDSDAGSNRPDDSSRLPDIIQNTSALESDSNSSAGFDGGSDQVRAPIPQSRGVLVDDPYHALPLPRTRARQPNRSVFDGFRDFQAEARRQEELLNSGSTSIVEEPNGNPSAIKSLQDLFRPPVDITFKGTFEEAKEAGKLHNKWLLVNIQDVKEFSCQTLNRDVWSNALVRELVAEHFILWQVYHDSEEGQRFMIYYPVKRFPNISIIDPRTGECLIVWETYDKIDSQLFCDLVTQFLIAHPDLVSENEFPPEKRQKTDSVIEKSEDQQLAAAIAASLEEDSRTGKSQTGEDSDIGKDDDIESFDYSDDESCSSKLKRDGDRTSINSEINQCTNKFKANSLDKADGGPQRCNVVEDGDVSKIEGPCTRLMLRLPEGNRKQIQMSIDATLKELQAYITSIGFPTKDYEIVVNFPRRNLTDVDSSRTLKEEKLFPQETIFVQER